MKATHHFGGILDGGQDILAKEMDGEVRILRLGEEAEDPPARGAALEGGIGQGLGEDGVDELLAEKQLAAARVLDDVCDGGGGGGARLGVRQAQQLDGGQDLCLAEGCELRIRRGLDMFGDGISAVG